MEKEHNTITDVINELKRLQVETGKNLPVIRYEEIQPGENEYFRPAWPILNEEKNRIEF